MSEHISSCCYRKIECENEGCGVSYCFMDLDEHKSICEYEKLTCLMSFGDLVCEEVVIRKDFAAHQHECPLRPVTCSNGCGCIMSVKDEKSHSCIKYLSEGMQALTRKNTTLRIKLDDISLLLEPLQRREEEHRRRGRTKKTRGRAKKKKKSEKETKRAKSLYSSVLLIPTECCIISVQRGVPLPISTLT